MPAAAVVDIEGNLVGIGHDAAQVGSQNSMV